MAGRPAPGDHEPPPDHRSGARRVRGLDGRKRKVEGVFAVYGLGCARPATIGPWLHDVASAGPGGGSPPRSMGERFQFTTFTTFTPGHGRPALDGGPGRRPPPSPPACWASTRPGSARTSDGSAPTASTPSLRPRLPPASTSTKRSASSPRIAPALPLSLLDSPHFRPRIVGLASPPWARAVADRVGLSEQAVTLAARERRLVGTQTAGTTGASRRQRWPRGRPRGRAWPAPSGYARPSSSQPCQ